MLYQAFYCVFSKGVMKKTEQEASSFDEAKYLIKKKCAKEYEVSRGEISIIGINIKEETANVCRV